MAKEQYTNTVDLIRDIAPDDQFAGELEADLDGRTVIRQLMAMRAARGLSQTELAGLLDCSQARISKLERSSDGDLRLSDLRAYADAVQAEVLVACIPTDMEATEKVKCHTFAINDHLAKLAELANTDDGICQGVVRFFGELAANFVWLMQDSARQLPRQPDGSPPFDIRLACGQMTTDVEDELEVSDTDLVVADYGGYADVLP